MKLSPDPAFFSFIAVGVINTLSTLIIIFVLMYCGCGDIPANAIGYVCGIMISFVLNKKMTFHCKNSSWRIFAKFLLVILVAYLANLAIVLFFIRIIKINEFLGQMCGMPFYTLISFFCCKYYVFRVNREVG